MYNLLISENRYGEPKQPFFPFTSKNREFTVLKKSTFMASCLEVNNVPYRRVPAGMTSLLFSRYPLSYLAFSCLETPKVSGVIPLPKTVKIFVSVSQRTTGPDNNSPLLESPLSAPRPIWSTYIFILYRAPSIRQNLPVASPACQFGIWKMGSFYSFLCLQSRRRKATLDLAETGCDLQMTGDTK